MTKIRVEKKNDFSIIPNSILRDKRLTTKARFMLIFCLSLADTWEYNASGLATVIGTGVDAVKAGLKELEQFGYLSRKQTRTGGKLGSMEYVLRESPLVENPLTEKPSTEKPLAENPLQYSTNEYSTNQKSIKAAKAFIPPTVDEVRNYIASKGYDVDADKFVDYYESNNWRDAKNQPVKNWKQRVVTWSGRNNGTYSRPSQKNNADYETIWDEVLRRIRGPWSAEGWSSSAVLSAVRKIGFSRLQQCSSYDLDKMKRAFLESYKEEMNGQHNL